jgi:hypothetical protein
MNERETLLARAKELGLDLPGTISNAKLKMAVAGKEAQLDAASGVAGNDGNGPSAAETVKEKPAKLGADGETTSKTQTTSQKPKTNADKPAPASKADPDLVNAVVLDQLKHNGTDYGPDETVELTQKQFDRLEHLGVVAAVEAD